MDFGPSRVTVDIPAFNEWRVETARTGTLNLKLESGTAEIFGTELSPNVDYVFKESMKIAVASYHGCQISYSTTMPLDSDYVSEETNLKQVLNLHLALDNRLQKTGKTSRVLIVGPRDTGKTTLARMLASYNLRTSDRSPILVNLNPQLPHFAIASQLTAAKVYDALDVETFTMGETSTTGPGTGLYRSQIPIVKNFGLENFNDNLELYRCLISELSAEVESKIEASPSDTGNVIIDTPALNVSHWKLIQHVIASFKIDILVVVGNERLLVDLRKKLALPEGFNMIKMPRSSGCVEKEPKYQRELQQRAIKQYFNGSERSQLNPYTFHSSINEFIFLKPTENDGSNLELLGFMNGDADEEEHYESAYPADEAEEDDDDYDPMSQTSTKTNTIKRTSKNWKYGKMFSIVDSPKEIDLTNVVVAIVDEKGLDLVKMASSGMNLKESLELINKHITAKGVTGFSYVTGCDDSTGKLKLLVPTPVTSMPGKILVITQMRYHE
jgi:polyribonucleotide 5'-hydroxyl-kinase